MLRQSVPDGDGGRKEAVMISRLSTGDTCMCVLLIVIPGISRLSEWWFRVDVDELMLDFI